MAGHRSAMRSQQLNRRWSQFGSCCGCASGESASAKTLWVLESVRIDGETMYAVYGRTASDMNRLRQWAWCMGWLGAVQVGSTDDVIVVGDRAGRDRPRWVNWRGTAGDGGSGGLFTVCVRRLEARPVY